ncbi:MAG: UDP-N-acetylmuramate dehydrogenase [Odoribacter sp.]|nr:UDP-N-acetylmuramate dehydrogenase [Odoribacter sp.]
MDITYEKSLKELHTFATEESCKCHIACHNTQDIQQVISDFLQKGTPYLVIGGGSDIVFTEHFNGIVISPLIMGIDIVSEGTNSTLVRAGAGVVWDDFVNWCIAHELWGAENMSGIPGHIGASPVQNVGAYGAEAGDIIKQVEAIEIATGKSVTIPAEECYFAYRNSRFKEEWKNRFIITHVLFELKSEASPNLSYSALQQAIETSTPTLQEIRNAVLSIRNSKLPDPALIPNAGSFFKNPIVDKTTANELKAQYPNIPIYVVTEEKTKIAAGWLIEQCGWKGKNLGPAGVYEKQALVLVNRGGAKGSDIQNLANAIIDSVQAKFNITLEPEVYIY